MPGHSRGNVLRAASMATDPTTEPRRLPAEWEPQTAVMLAWPHPETDWAPWLAEVEATYLELALQIGRRQRLVILCRDTSLQEQVHARLHERGLSDERLICLAVPYNDTWVRDYGPLSVFAGNTPRLLDFRFDGWGGKYPAARDDAVTGRLHRLGLFGDTPLERPELVLEGGAIDHDGQGSLLATRRCLLHPNRNPGMTQEAMEAYLRALLGVRRILWLEHGHLEGDDTDGHIDMLARFCDPGTIAHVVCRDPADPHHAALREMVRELATMRRPDGRPYRLVPLPLPQARYDETGRRLPASYANFLIIDEAVLVPVYGDAADGEALRTLSGCFPGRQVVPIPAAPLIRQSGSVHCVTMQLPAGVPLILS